MRRSGELEINWEIVDFGFKKADLRSINIKPGFIHPSMGNDGLSLNLSEPRR